MSSSLAWLAQGGTVKYRVFFSPSKLKTGRAADEAVLNKEHKKIQSKPPV
jgi:hypothetical protein